MIDKRYMDSYICLEQSPEDREKWYGCTKKKFLHNIDTFYYSVKFKQDFRLKSEDKHVLRMRSYFKYRYDGMGNFGDTQEIRLKEIDKRLVLKPVTFSRFYTICLSYPEYFDIFIAPVVPKALDGGQSVTCECIVQIRSYMLWMFGVHAAFENSYRYVKSLADYFHLDVDFVQENRIDYCWHSNYLKDPETFFNPDNFYKMRVDRFKNATYVTNKVGSEDYEIDYVCLGKRSDKVFVRIYQKTREVVEQNYKPWFFQIWKMNGLLSAYDVYVYEKAYKKRSWFYRYYARLEFYAEYGKHPFYVQMCKDVISGDMQLSEDELIRLSKQLTPDPNIIINVEYQTMRRHSKSYELLPFRDNSNTGECKRIYDYLDNRKLIMDYLTSRVFKLVEKTGDSNKSRRPMCGFWQALRSTRCIDVKMTPEQLELVRTYNRKLNVEAMKKRVIDSAVMLGFYQRGINTDDPLQDAAEALLRMNDNDIEQARKYKTKKSRLLNEDELAGTIEYDAAAHLYDIIRTDTGDIYSQNTLSDWTCQGG